MAGRLLVCATPIGNLGDVTLRVLEALREADVIAAEDTRVTRKLLARYDIHTPLERFDEHTSRARVPELLSRIEQGETVALVSDAGTPGISDPGHELVDACRQAGAAVEVLPGPSAIVAALVASGLPTHAFYFGGFLPRKDGEARRALRALADLDATLVFYESPQRTASTLVRIAEELPGRTAAMVRELTKLHEEVLRDDVDALSEAVSDRELKGEVVLVVGPPPARPSKEAIADVAAIRERVSVLVDQGVSRRDAVREVAQEFGVSRNVVYDIAHEAG